MSNSRLPDFLIIPSVIIQNKTMQPLDGLVYGVVYWYSKLKLEKCVASNEQIAILVQAKNIGSITNSLTRLKKQGFIKVILDPATNHRLEIIPLISFNNKSEIEIINTEDPTSNDGGPYIKYTKPPTSNDVDNNIDLIRTSNNKQKEIIKKKYSSREEILESDLEEIANHYQVPVSFVKSKLEDVCLWEDSKPGRMKNRNWRMTLMAWVKRDAINIRQESYGKSTIGFINTD
jgi:hypothetical protein